LVWDLCGFVQFFSWSLKSSPVKRIQRCTCRHLKSLRRLLVSRKLPDKQALVNCTQRAIWNSV
jgi:hypothetical protein